MTKKCTYINLTGQELQIHVAWVLKVHKFSNQVTKILQRRKENQIV